MGKNEGIDRRTFLVGAGVAALAARAAEPPSSGGRVHSLNRNWLFGGKAQAGFAQPDFDDSKWERVTLPHSNVRLPWHSFEEKDFQYVSAYRRHFRPAAGWKGK